MRIPNGPATLLHNMAWLGAIVSNATLGQATVATVTFPLQNPDRHFQLPCQQRQQTW